MTNSLARRMYQHRSGEFEGFAAQYQGKTLIYYEHYRDVRDAIARESQLKKWSRAKKVELSAKMNPRRDDLAPPIVDEQ